MHTWEAPVHDSLNRPRTEDGPPAVAEGWARSSLRVLIWVERGKTRA